MTALSLADGEGRNGVWLAGQGLTVTTTDISPVGIAKARRLAATRGVAIEALEVDLDDWAWPPARFDLVAAIFIQFATPARRSRIFAGIQTTLKPDGLLVLQGYRPEQLAYGTGGPKEVSQLYTEAMLREAFAGMEILHLASHDTDLAEGSGHAGRSALIDLVARRR
jgi:cyclopropane fatty-acyl-phospholipid synthase-like methyltransferase